MNTNKRSLLAVLFVLTVTLSFVGFGVWHSESVVADSGGQIQCSDPAAAGTSAFNNCMIIYNDNWQCLGICKSTCEYLYGPNGYCYNHGLSQWAQCNNACEDAARAGA